MSNSPCEPNIAHDNCDFIKCEGIETETEVIETSGTSLTPRFSFAPLKRQFDAGESLR